MRYLTKSELCASKTPIDKEIVLDIVDRLTDKYFAESKKRGIRPVFGAFVNKYLDSLNT